MTFREEQRCSSCNLRIYSDELKDFSNFLVVKSSRASMAPAANVIYGHPSEKINIIGITGTNGKTSSTYLLKCIYDYLNENLE